MRVYVKKAMSERLAKHRVSLSGCWEWTGSKDRDGYGRMIGSENGARTFQFAHRASFEHYVRTLVDNEQVLHHCDNPCCINPSHLYAGNPKLNGADKRNRGRARSVPRFGKDNPMFGKTGTLNPMFGRSHTEETRRKISEAKRRK